MFRMPSGRKGNVGHLAAYTAATLLPEAIVILFPFEYPGQVRVELRAAGTDMGLAESRRRRVPDADLLCGIRTGEQDTLLLLKKVEVILGMLFQHSFKDRLAGADAHGEEPVFVFSEPGIYPGRHIQAGLEFPVLPTLPGKAATGRNGTAALFRFR